MTLTFQWDIILTWVVEEGAVYHTGGYDKLDKTLIHRGAFNENYDDHYKDLKALYISLPLESGKNTIVSSHNSVVHHDMFDSTVLESNMYSLEEGGFFVISVENKKLILEHRFYSFKDFIISFYPPRVLKNCNLNKN